MACWQRGVRAWPAQTPCLGRSIILSCKLSKLCCYTHWSLSFMVTCRNSISLDCHVQPVLVELWMWFLLESLWSSWCQWITLGNLTDLQQCLMKCTHSVRRLNQMQVKRPYWSTKGLCQVTHTPQTVHIWSEYFAWTAYLVHSMHDELQRRSLLCQAFLLSGTWSLLPMVVLNLVNNNVQPTTNV